MAVMSYFTTLAIALCIFGGVQGKQKRNLTTTVVTYNTALTPMSAPLYEERKLKMGSAVGSLDADIVCLQEVVYEDDMRSIMKELVDEYPYSYSFLHESIDTAAELADSENARQGEKSFPCQDSGFQVFSNCFEGKCSQATSMSTIVLCGFMNCIKEAFALEQDCLSCMAFSFSSLGNVVAKCATPSTSGRNRFNAQGLLLLSKYSFEKAQTVAFNPDYKQMLPRGAITVFDEHMKGYVACTRLSTALKGFPYFEVVLAKELNMTSFAEQQRTEISMLTQSIPRDSPAIIAGDLNTGPAVPGEDVVAELKDNYDAFSQQSLFSPYVEMDGRCTFCNENPLIPSTPNQIYDHVLLRGMYAKQATRVLDRPGVMGRPGLRPSDHYGVSVTIDDDFPAM